MNKTSILTLLLMIVFWATVSHAEASVPWGRVSLDSVDYKPQKVLSYTGVLPG